MFYKKRNKQNNQSLYTLYLHYIDKLCASSFDMLSFATANWAIQFLFIATGSNNTPLRCLCCKKVGVGECGILEQFQFVCLRFYSLLIREFNYYTTPPNYQLSSERTLPAGNEMWTYLLACYPIFSRCFVICINLAEPDK